MIDHPVKTIKIQNGSVVSETVSRERVEDIPFYLNRMGLEGWVLKTFTPNTTYLDTNGFREFGAEFEFTRGTSI